VRCAQCFQPIPAGAVQCPTDGGRPLQSVAEALKAGPSALSLVVKVADGTLEQLEQLHARGKAVGVLGPDAVLFGQQDEGLVVALWPGDGAVLSPYRAPGIGPGPEADVFAVGVLVHHMITGVMPPEGGGLPPLSMGGLQDVPDALQDLITHMTQPLPAERESSLVRVRERLENVVVDSTLSGQRVAALRRQIQQARPERQVMLSAPHAPAADPFADTLIGTREQVEAREAAAEAEADAQDTLLAFSPADAQAEQQARLQALDARTTLLPESEPEAAEPRTKWVLLGIAGGLAVGGAAVALMSLL